MLTLPVEGCDITQESIEYMYTAVMQILNDPGSFQHATDSRYMAIALTYRGLGVMDTYRLLHNLEMIYQVSLDIDIIESQSIFLEFICPTISIDYTRLFNRWDRGVDRDYIPYEAFVRLDEVEAVIDPVNYPYRDAFNHARRLWGQATILSGYDQSLGTMAYRVSVDEISHDTLHLQGWNENGLSRAGGNVRKTPRQSYASKFKVTGREVTGTITMPISWTDREVPCIFKLPITP